MQGAGKNQKRTPTNQPVVYQPTKKGGGIKIGQKGWAFEQGRNVRAGARHPNTEGEGHWDPVEWDGNEWVKDPGRERYFGPGTQSDPFTIIGWGLPVPGGVGEWLSQPENLMSAVTFGAGAYLLGNVFQYFGAR